ncbi:MAG: ABC transporter permease [Chloroflexota bacterium]|nr:ABC transporter permease [Chloroflexota bacterium]
MIKPLASITAFIGKEMRELIRRPGALISLLLGPLIIMAVFGVGYTGTRRPFDAIVVVPPDSGLPEDVGVYQDLAAGRLNVVEVTADAEVARTRLEHQQIGLVVVAPADPGADLRAGRQSIVTVEWNQVDPVGNSLAQFVVSSFLQELNRRIIEQAAAEGIAYLEAAGETRVELTPELLASPARAETRNIAPSTPGVLRYFGPAVFALVLQHLAVTITALSIVRERLSGAIDLFRVAPVSTLEVLLGKYVAFGALSSLLALLISILMIELLGLPLLGGWAAFAGVVGLIIFASLGLGLLISTTSDSERQAVQLSMLLLLASVFFSGLVLPAEEFVPQVRAVAYLLPVTHGIRLLQDLMLRGGTNAGWEVSVLAAIGVVLFLLTAVRLRALLARG